jgi:hypothetical protein
MGLIHRGREQVRVGETHQGFTPGLFVRRRQQDAIDIKYSGCQSWVVKSGSAGFSKRPLPGWISLSYM